MRRTVVAVLVMVAVAGCASSAAHHHPASTYPPQCDRILIVVGNAQQEVTAKQPAALRQAARQLRALGKSIKIVPLSSATDQQAAGDDLGLDTLIAAEELDLYRAALTQGDTGQVAEFAVNAGNDLGKITRECGG